MQCCSIAGPATVQAGCAGQVVPVLRYPRSWPQYRAGPAHNRHASINFICVLMHEAGSALASGCATAILYVIFAH